ncbi:MAG: sensor histidine kinase [Gemmiger sp.]
MLEHHLELIDAKASQIKQLADNIFEYSLVSRQQEIKLEPPAPAQQIFHDLLSEYIYQWSRHGLELTFELDWTDIRISVYSPYIKRTMDNISSNLMKYANNDQPVLIKVAAEQDSFCLTVQNRIANEVTDEESTHIGLSNIEMMMQKMNGACHVQEAADTFSITLIFPACIG